MGMNHLYTTLEPQRAEINMLAGPAVIEFGTAWCGYCRAAQLLIAEALSQYPAMQHIKIEDGKGRPLGRSFRVTLWPTLIFLRDGKEISRLIRPADATQIEQALAQIA
jgi:thioredoxin 1